MKLSLVKGILMAAMAFFALPALAQTPYQIEKLPDTAVYNDFVVGPGKLQLDLKPGESRTINITVTNRLGTEKAFAISMEDIRGSNDPAQTVVLLGSDRGPYSLKDYVHVASSTFILGHAERATIPVTVSVPADAQPGGLYGSVIIQTVTAPSGTNTAGSAGKNPIITRIGTLFFIRVAGAVKQEGKLAKFSLKNNAYILGAAKQIDFRLLFENTGTIHLNPYGLITVKNIFNAPVGTVEVEPWFALPDSLRLREVAWNPAFLFGRYTATAEINRGYDNTIDTATVTFWVIPWKIILAIFAGIVIIVAGLRFVFSKFSISIKK